MFFSSPAKISKDSCRTAPYVRPVKESGKLQRKISFVRKLQVRVFNLGR